MKLAKREGIAKKESRLKAENRKEEKQTQSCLENYGSLLGLRISDYRFQITDYGLRISDYGLRIFVPFEGKGLVPYMALVIVVAELTFRLKKSPSRGTAFLLNAGT